MPSTVVCQMGGLGDVVLTSSVVASLKRSDPTRPVYLVCREEFRSLATLFPVAPDICHGVALNPYQWTAPDADLVALVRRTLLEVSIEEPCELFIAAEYKPTWFSSVFASGIKASNTIAATHASRESFLGSSISRKLQLEPVVLQGPDTAMNLAEHERYRALVNAAGARFEDPAWHVDPEIAEQAKAWLDKSGFSGRDYLVCFPLGAASIPFKRWPTDRFVSVLRNIGMPVLVTGTIAEQPELDAMAAEFAPGCAQVFAGQANQLQLLAGLVSGARAYLGNDTGTMHLATAYGVPGVAIFGGGHWPVYVPAKPGSVAVASPIPCFGCDWDCAFGHGLCVERIREEDVAAALEDVLRESKSAAAIREVSPPLPSEAELIRDAGLRYREAAAERDRRLHWIVELQENLRQSESENERLREAAEERLRDLHGKDNALAAVRSEAERVRVAAEELTDIVDARDALIEDLEQLATERLVALEVGTAAHKAVLVEADRRDQALREMASNIDLLSRECELRLQALQTAERTIAELSEAGQERLAALETASSAVDDIRREADQRAAEMERMAAALREQQDEIGRLTVTCAERLSASEEIRTEADRRAEAMNQMAETIREQRDEIALLSATCAERLSASEEIRTEAERRAQSMSEMSNEIRMQQEHIVQLSAACEERLNALKNANAAADELRNEADLRFAAIERLTAESEERLKALAAATTRAAALEQEAAKRAEQMAVMSVEINRLTDECNLRLQSLESANATIEQLREEVATLSSACGLRLNALEAANAEVSRLHAEAARLRSVGLERLESLTAASSEIERLNSLSESLKNQMEKQAQEAARTLEESDGKYGTLQDENRKMKIRISELESRYEYCSTRLIALHKESLYNFLVRRYGGSRRDGSSG